MVDHFFYFGLFFDDGMDIELVVGVVIGCVVLIPDLDEDIGMRCFGDAGGVEEFRVMDLLHGAGKGFFEVGVRIGQELVQDVGAFMDERPVDGGDLYGFFGVPPQRIDAGCDHGEVIFYSVGDPALQNIGLDGRDISRPALMELFM